MAHSDLPSEVGTIVVGGGTGGAACAGLLAERGADDVLLLEAGPDYGAFTDGGWPADLLDAAAVPLSHDWGLDTGGDPSGHVLDLPRARVLGGCSAHNGCTASLGAREDYDAWSALGNPGWDAATVEPLLTWVHQRFRVRRYGTDELTSAQAAFVAAGMRAGLPFADDLDDLAAGVGIGPMPVNIVDGVRWNAAFAFLDPARETGRLSIAGDSPVRRVRTDHGRVTGVEVMSRHGPRVVRADRVVVAGGAYLSPTLLLRSGIGPADEVRAAGIHPLVDLPGVGRHLLDHVCVQLDFHGKDGLLEELARTPWHPDEQTVGRARSTRCDSGPYDIHVFMVAGANSGHPGLPPVSLYGGAMCARSEGQVRLGESSPDDPPLIDHRYATDPDGHDRAVLAEALGLLHDLTTDRQLATLLGPAASTDDPLARPVSYCHPVGTCRLGPADDPLAVVDATGAVHGLTGLYVADASLMPSITRGNVNLPTAMIGARVAAGLLGLSHAAAVTTHAMPR